MYIVVKDMSDQRFNVEMDCLLRDKLWINTTRAQLSMTGQLQIDIVSFQQSKR